MDYSFSVVKQEDEWAAFARFLPDPINSVWMMFLTEAEAKEQVRKWEQQLGVTK